VYVRHVPDLIQRHTLVWFRWFLYLRRKIKRRVLRITQNKITTEACVCVRGENHLQTCCHMHRNGDQCDKTGSRNGENVLPFRDTYQKQIEQVGEGAG
jgi:hypothetical protein